MKTYEISYKNVEIITLLVLEVRKKYWSNEFITWYF